LLAPRSAYEELLKLKLEHSALSRSFAELSRQGPSEGAAGAGAGEEAREAVLALELKASEAHSAALTLHHQLAAAQSAAAALQVRASRSRRAGEAPLRGGNVRPM
jgi:hypothetical protein